MPRVFLSYMSENGTEAARLARALTQRGVEVWRDKDRLRPGQRWADEVRKGIQEGDFFVACFSSAYGSRDRTYMNEELVTAVDELRLRPYGKEWFIPVRLDDCAIPSLPIGFGQTLDSLQRVDLWRDFEGAVDLIMRTVLPHGGEAYLHHSYLYEYLVHKSGRVDVQTTAELTVLRDRISKGGSGWTLPPNDVAVEVHVLSGGRAGQVVRPTVSPPSREGMAFWWDTRYASPLLRGERIRVITRFHYFDDTPGPRKDSFHAFRAIENFSWRVRFGEGLEVSQWEASCDYVAAYGDGHVLARSAERVTQIAYDFGRLDKGGVYYLAWQYA